MSNETGINIGPIAEVVMSVTDIDRSAALFSRLNGWQRIHDGDCDWDIRKFYGTPRDSVARQAVFECSSIDGGRVRLIQWSGIKQQLMRPGVQSWDTGGIFDINFRVRNIDKVVEAFNAAGWQEMTSPVRYPMGPLEVSECLVRDTNGVVAACIERIEPPLPSWPYPGSVGNVFNSTQIVRDTAAARSFYVDQLGFSVRIEHRGPLTETAGPNVLGIPHNLVANMEIDLLMLIPPGGSDGGIEIVSFDSLSGADVSARCTPTNLGLVALRFAVDDINALEKRLIKQDIAYNRYPALKFPPRGLADVIVIHSPEGARLEFLQHR